MRKNAPNDSWPILFWPSVSFLSVSHNGRVAWTRLRSTDRPSGAALTTSGRGARQRRGDGGPPVTVETLVVAWTPWARGGGAASAAAWSGGVEEWVGVGVCGLWTVDRPVGTLASPGPASLPLPAAHAAPFDSAGLRTRGGHRGRYSAWGSGVRCLGRRMGSCGEEGVTWLRGPRVGIFFKRRGRRSHDS